MEYNWNKLSELTGVDIMAVIKQAGFRIIIIWLQTLFYTDMIVGTVLYNAMAVFKYFSLCTDVRLSRLRVTSALQVFATLKTC